MITNLLILAFLPLQIFLLLAILVSAAPQGFWLEHFILLSLHQTANPLLDSFAQSVTTLGIYGGTLPIIVLVSGILTYQKKWRSLLYVMITALGSIGLSYGTKYAFDRLRPHLWESIYTATSPAFPSGHALSSMMLAMVIVILTWETPWRWLTFFLSAIFVLLIAWTRLYLGVHYPSDILGGWSLAIAWCLFAKSLVIQPNSEFPKTKS
jgi:membrane-associated phospholipid phosphatase